jgi:hypothetical protein
MRWIGLAVVLILAPLMSMPSPSLAPARALEGRGSRHPRLSNVDGSCPGELEAAAIDHYGLIAPA